MEMNRLDYLPAARLCPTCQMLFDDIGTTDTVSLDCQSISRNSSYCFICLRLAKHYVVHNRIDARDATQAGSVTDMTKLAGEMVNFRLGWRFHGFQRRLMLHMIDGLGSENGGMVFRHFDYYRGENQYVQDDRVEPELALQRSQGIQIRHWLGNCAQHATCSRPTTHSTAHEAVSSCAAPAAEDTKRSRPTRLVHVGKDSSGMRLVLTTESQNYVYATLSHCWGTRPFETLRRHNYRDFLMHIVPSILTKTFAEAIALCRRLDIAYIWIDSLCIIQEDVEDFRTEISMMDHIYANAFVNFAATASRDGSEGLFRPINHPASGCIPFDTYQVITQQPEFLYDLYQDNPLFKRGWIVQGMALSPRTIHFTDVSIYWRCRQLNDNWPGVIPYQVASQKEKLDLQSLDTVWQVDMAWLGVSEKFSATTVTKAEDHVLALLPLAQHFARRFTALGCATTYVAGCWTHHIFLFLSWVSISSDIKRKSSANVPSWSWLFDRGEVHFPYKVYHNQGNACGTHSATLLDMEIMPDAPSAPGDWLKYNHLLIEAMWCQASLSGPLSRVTSLDVRHRLVYMDCDPRVTVHHWWDHVWLDENQESMEQEFTVLVLAYCESTFRSTWRLLGLICRPVHVSEGVASATGPVETLTRCGAFEIKHCVSEGVLLSEFQPAKKFWLV